MFKRSLFITVIGVISLSGPIFAKAASLGLKNTDGLPVLDYIWRAVCQAFC